MIKFKLDLPNNTEVFNYYNRNKLYGSIISYQYDILESGHCRMCNNWTINHVITKLVLYACH